LGAEKGESSDGVKRAKEGSLVSRSSLETTGLRPHAMVEVLRVQKNARSEDRFVGVLGPSESQGQVQRPTP
jgi:hypothetical protein